MSEMKHTPGPWEYVPSNENHGPYVTNGWGAGDICDCYVMSNPNELAVCNGGTSKPIHMQYDEADANARLIAAAPDLSEAAKRARRDLAAIKKFAEWCHDSPASLAGHINEGLPSIAASLAALDAAIAKAEGRA